METTRYIRSDGLDLGEVLLEKEYFLSNYTSIANQYITPELWGWGDNTYYQLGLNTNYQYTGGTIKLTPVTTFSGGSNWKSISVGLRHSAAIKTDGTLWTWGTDNNFHLLLGINNTMTTASTPVTTFAGGTNWKQVSCGAYHSAAIKTDGTLWVWGNNYKSKLGINSDRVVSTPVTTFSGGNNWKQVSCSFNYNAAIKTDGTLWTWGINAYGELGINNSLNRSTPVTTFAGGNNWKQVSCGIYHAAAIKTDGTLWIWGYNGSGQLGINDTTNRSTPVTTFAGGNNWKQVSCGYFRTAAIKTDGTLWTWGSGTLGNNVTFNSIRFTPVTTFSGGTNWKKVFDGFDHTIAIKTDGTLWVWGSSATGQLGNGDIGTISRTPITTVLGGSNWKDIATFNYASTNLAIRSYDEY